MLKDALLHKDKQSLNSLIFVAEFPLGLGPSMNYLT